MMERIGLPEGDAVFRDQIDDLPNRVNARAIVTPVQIPRIEQDGPNAGCTGPHYIDVIQVADVDRGLRPRAGLLQSELKITRIRLFDADDVRVEDDIERLG